MTCAAEDKAADTYGNLDLINIIAVFALCNRVGKSFAGPGFVNSAVIPIVEVYYRPIPIIFKVNNYSILEIKLAAFGANTVYVYMITGGRYCNFNFSTGESNGNGATILGNGIRLVICRISSTPIVVTYNLECVRACRNVLIYLSIYAVCIGHIVSCVACIPLCTKMRAATCYCEGSLGITSCAKMACVEAMSESGNYRNAAIITYLRSSTCCLVSKICVEAFSNRSFNLDLSSSTCKGNCNSAAAYNNTIRLVLFGIRNIPAVVTCNLKLVCTCRNVLVYLSVYAVSIGHIVSCVACIPFCTKMSACTCYCEGSCNTTSCATMIAIFLMSKSGNYNCFTLITYLTFSTCCRRTKICVLTFGIYNGIINVNINCSTLEGDSNGAARYRNLKALVRTGISSSPVVVTCNLKLVCTCRNVLIYLSVYAVSIGHIVIGVGGAPI